MLLAAQCLLPVQAALAQDASAPRIEAQMVWIHGGGFVTGSGSEYDAHILAETQDVIVVTINYRLGALGFLSHPAFGDESGNFGFLDQQTALRWVHRNIEAFRGDPERVTIFGESAGGVSVCAHLASPGSAGLFSRAINQSGPCVAFPRAAADQKGINYAQAANCPPEGEEALACLRAIPALTVAANSPGDTGAGDTPRTLVNGTPVLPDASVYASGAFNRAPVINGSNRDEGRLFAAAALPLLQNEDAYIANARTQFGANADKVLAEYPASAYDTVALAFAAYMTDFLFACPAYQVSTAMSAHTPVFAYEFSDRTGRYFRDAPPEIGSFGAHHAKEIQFIFRTPSFFSGPAEFTPEQLKLSERMMQAWASFARDGVPSIRGEATWEPMRPDATWIRHFDTTDVVSVSDFAEAHSCGFWSSL
jgi:para-nitrobenzyl esterase